jgi:copper resistance protein B
VRKLLVLLAASALATPSLAQHSGHSETPSPEPACTPEHAAMGHCTMPEKPANPHAGHEMPGQEGDPHAGHKMGATPQPPSTPPPPEALTGPENAADAVYGSQRMAEAREELRREHGALPAYRIFIDRVEARLGDGSNAYLVEGQAWYGGDIDKLWLKSEIEGEFQHGVEEAEVQALWSHGIDPWFDAQVGVRYDARRGPDRGHLVLGVQGLAPYWWEVEGAVFLSDEGEVTARGEAEYDLRVTQKLILQPRVEVDLSAEDIPDLRIGAGLSESAVGVRLRYEITKLFAPYVGVEYERTFGQTARYRRAKGQGAGAWSLLAGFRTWF